VHLHKGGIFIANFHCSVQTLSRGKGQSAVAAAAYRSGERLHDRYYGMTYDYTKKGGIVHNEIILPSNAPPEFYDRETLWNAVEDSEKRKNSRIAREVEIALPHELTLTDQIRLTKIYIIDNFINKNMCADFSVHDKNGNFHSHILLTTREINERGFQKKNRNWDKRENIELWREEWANAQNKIFEQRELKIKVSHKSYVRQNIRREPTKYLGRASKQLEKHNIKSERGNENRIIIERNAEREQKRIREKNRNRIRET